MKILINLILLVIAWLLMRVLITVSFVYTVSKLLLKSFFFLDARYLVDLSDWLYDSALTIDMSGNIIGQHFFNDLMIKPDGYRFGFFNVTISKTLAINKKQGKMYAIGRGLGWLLNKIDKNHLEDSER